MPQANRATVITTVLQSIQLISYYWFSITCVGRDLKCVGKMIQDILSTYIQPLSVVLLTTSRHLFIWLSSSGQPNHFLATEELLIVQFALKWYYILIFKWILFKCWIENYAWFIFLSATKPKKRWIEKRHETPTSNVEIKISIFDPTSSEIIIFNLYIFNKRSCI